MIDLNTSTTPNGWKASIAFEELGLPYTTVFESSGVGPMQGQANVLFRYFPEKIPSVTARYQNETKRLYTVLDTRLRDHEFLVDDYSIPDIAHWAWVRLHDWAGVSVDDLPNLQRWMTV